MAAGLILPSLRETYHSKAARAAWENGKQLPWQPAAHDHAALDADAAHALALPLLRFVERALVPACWEGLDGERRKNPLLFPLVDAQGKPICMPACALGVAGFKQTADGYLQLNLCARESVRGRCTSYHRDYAHRLVCWLFHGMPGAPGMQCAHLCGRRNCLNPRHLRWVMPKTNQNMATWHALPHNFGLAYPHVDDQAVNPHEFDDSMLERLRGVKKRTRRPRGRPRKQQALPQQPHPTLPPCAAPPPTHHRTHASPQP